MTTVITGDIINSRGKEDQQSWMAPLKKLLSGYGKTPKVWDMYRGDSFQAEVKNPEDALMTAIRIKACIRSVEELDVRIAIGIGDKTYDAPKIVESNGTAFIYSGELLEQLKKSRQTLGLRSPWPDMDRTMNLAITLGCIAMDKWTNLSAELIGASLKYNTLSQQELGRKLNRSQSSISEAFTRGYYNEIRELEKFFREEIKKHID